MISKGITNLNICDSLTGVWEGRTAERILLFSRYLQRYWACCLLCMSYVFTYHIIDEDFVHAQNFILLLFAP